MALPVAIVVYSDTPIAAASLPSSRTFSASTSTPGTGATSIVGYQWYLLDKPPGSTASLLNDTSVTCTLQNIDLAGSYRLFCVVEDDEGALSVEEPQPVQSGSAPYSFSVPPTSAFAVVTALTRYAGLKKVAYGELQWLESGLWPVIDSVDILRRDVNNASSGQPEGVVFITSGDGEVDANGTPARPFNPASAVAAGFTGPWQQAQAALLNLELADRRPRTIVAMGGVYDEDVDLSVEGVLYEEEPLYELDAPQWCIFTAGLVSFEATRKFSFSVTAPAGDGVAIATLTIAPYIGGLDTTGFVLANPAADALGIGASANAYAIVNLTNVTANVGVKTLLNNAGITFRKCEGDVLLPSAGVVFDEHSANSVEVTAVRRADRSTLGNVTVAASTGTGYYGCNIDSFTGPANSAKFDLTTAAAFESVSGVFSGGAGIDDYLKVGKQIVSNGDMNVIAGNTMIIATMGGNMEIMPTTNGVDGAPFHVYSPYINLSTGLVGQAWLGGASAVAAVKVYNDSPTPGNGVIAYGEEVTINGNGTGDTINLHATQAGGNISIRTEEGDISLTTVNGSLTVTTTGAGSDASFQVAGELSASAASVSLEAGTGEVAITALANNVVITAPETNVDSVLRAKADGGNLAKVPNVLDSYGLAETATPGTVKFVFRTHTILSGHQATAGSFLKGTARFKLAANANSKVVGVDYAGALLFSHTTTSSGKIVTLDWEIVRDSINATTGQLFVEIREDGVVVSTPTLSAFTTAWGGSDKDVDVWATTATNAGDVDFWYSRLECGAP